MATRSLNIHISIPRPLKLNSPPPTFGYRRLEAVKIGSGFRRKVILCSASPDSSTATVRDTKEAGTEEAPPPPLPAAAAAATAKEATVKTKKAPAKPLPEMMEEDIIPSLLSTLEGQEEISQIEISFQENRLEGSFMKKDKPYYFWAFFPDGSLTGPKGFSLSSYGVGASTIEPFLVDERKITDKHVVFWIRKRLAAQGILPVWKE